MLTGSTRPTAAAVHDAGDVVDAAAGLRRQGLVGPFLGSVADELRHRLAADCGRALQLLVEVRVEAEASHGMHESRQSSFVSRAICDLREAIALPCPQTFRAEDRGVARHRRVRAGRPRRLSRTLRPSPGGPDRRSRASADAPLCASDHGDWWVTRGRVSSVGEVLVGLLEKRLPACVAGGRRSRRVVFDPLRSAGSWRGPTGYRHERSIMVWSSREAGEGRLVRDVSQDSELLRSFRWSPRHRGSSDAASARRGPSRCRRTTAPARRASGDRTPCASRRRRVRQV